MDTLLKVIRSSPRGGVTGYIIKNKNTYVMARVNAHAHKLTKFPLFYKSLPDAILAANKLLVGCNRVKLLTKQENGLFTSNRLDLDMQTKHIKAYETN